MNHFFFFLALALLVFSVPVAAAAHATIDDRVDWPGFLARHDLVWDQTPTKWQEGAFLGDGRQGAMIYAGEGDALRWDVNRSDVTGRGKRIPVGQIVLVPAGKPAAGSNAFAMRLDLWNAEATGTLTTDKGAIQWRSFAHSTADVLVIEWESTAGEQACRWEWRALPALDPRKLIRNEPIGEADKNPEPVRSERSDGVHTVTQPLKTGAYAVAWREERVAPNKQRLFLRVGFSHQEAADAEREAVESVRAGGAQRFDDLLASHRAWWHRFFPASFVSVPDTRLESFYWIQMYKLGAATRADRPALDLMGPWFRATPWAAIWWNLNIQLTYWPVYASNHLDLGESLTRLLDNAKNNFALNVPDAMRADSAAIGRVSSYDGRASVGTGGELGNLAWALHNYYLQYRYTMDDRMLREQLLPLLRRSINFYLHLLTLGPDNKLHLPVAVSPEYPLKAGDTNYDLSLLRWGCQTLIAACNRLKIDDPLLPTWKKTLVDLAPYPVDEKTGLMIGADVPLAQSHRHFSHLLMVYPLRTLTPDQAADRALIEKSLDHWIGFKGALQGYSYTGASSLSTILGRREAAVNLLNEFLDRYVKPNTMYLEAGPVIETPLAGAASIQQLLLESAGDTIRVFPGVPPAWPNAVFRDLRAEGAFLVSAARRNGKTAWVRITSLAGEPCHVATDIDEPVEAQNTAVARLVTITSTRPGVVTLDLRKGETVILHPRGVASDLIVAPVPAQPGRANLYGLRRPAPITAGLSGVLDLPAARAVIHGETLFYEKSATKNNLGRWTNARDWASWTVRVARPGRYAVLVSYGAPASSAGGVFSVGLAGGAPLTTTVSTTGDFDTYAKHHVGDLTFGQAGDYTVEVRAVETGHALLNKASGWSRQNLHPGLDRLTAMLL